MTKMLVEIWADIVCPWCYIGKRRFDRALRRFDSREHVAVRHRSFQLDPSSPREASETLAERTRRDLGLPTIDEARNLHRHVEELALEEGLTYNLGEARLVNSFDAHRLLHFADDGPHGDSMRERLYAAYAIEGATISDHATLVRLGEEVGLSGVDIRTIVDSDRYADAVAADRAAAQRQGVHGVPQFLFGGELLTGTRSVDDFDALLDRSLRRHRAKN